MKIFIQAASCSLGVPSTLSVDLICAPPCQSPLLQLLALLRVFPATSQLPKRETRTFRIFVCTTTVSCSTAVPALSSCCRRCATDVDLLGITNRYTNNSIRVASLARVHSSFGVHFICASISSAVACPSFANVFVQSNLKVRVLQQCKHSSLPWHPVAQLQHLHSVGSCYTSS